MNVLQYFRAGKSVEVLLFKVFENFLSVSSFARIPFMFCFIVLPENHSLMFGCKPCFLGEGKAAGQSFQIFLCFFLMQVCLLQEGKNFLFPADSCRR